jgi:hypothetical protein
MIHTKKKLHTFICLFINKYPIGLIILFTLSVLLTTPIFSQTILLDDFNRANNNTVGAPWLETETVSPTSANITSNRLQLGSGTAGRDWVCQDVSAKYTTNGITDNTLVLTWAFNFRSSRPAPSGFDASNYGIAFILGKTTNDVTLGNGYAVVIGQSGSPDPIRLSRFTGGPDLNSNFTDIISGGNYATEYMSIKVTFDPSTDTWSLYAESNAAAFPQADPRNTTTQIGSSTVNSTYTSAGNNLLYMGCFWNHSTGATENAIFDDIYIPSPTTPTLVCSPLTLSGFTYAFGSGPSPSQMYVLSGTNLTGFPNNITVTGSANYDVSLDDITFGASGLVPYSSATLADVNIYVRLKAGLAVGAYNGQLITNAGGGAVTVNVTCNGTVTGPTLTPSVSNISGMDYLFGAGPSVSQSYTLSGVNLTGFPGNITVAGVTNFELSLNNIAFSPSLSIPYGSATLAPTTIYARLKSGLAINTYTETITHNGGGASCSVTANGIVNDPLALPTIFNPGDIAIVGVNSNIICISPDAGADEISFVAFKDINTGTKFYVTDNGYQRVNAGKWGDTEGLYEFTRTGGTIAAGTVITFRFLNASPFMVYVYPDANWTYTKVPGFAGNLVLNTNGDQMYFMQGGTWVNGGGTHDAIYTPGIYLFAFNTYSAWVDFGASTQRSGLIPGMECFSMMPGVATDFIKFNSSIDGWSATSKRGWIDRINNPLNWINCGGATPTISCNNYNSTAPDYAAGYSISISAGGFSPGVWTGSKDINWFNCENWQDMTIPDSTTNVRIPSGVIPNEPTIGDPPSVPVAYTSAYCNDIRVFAGRTLTMNHVNSKLGIYGNFALDGTLSHTLGTIYLRGNANNTFGGTSAINIWKLETIKDAYANTTTLGQNVTINSDLTLTRGKIITSTYTISVENNIPAAVIAGTGNTNFANSYIIGFLKRKIASNTSTYDFPVGISANPRLAQFVNNNLLTTNYITVSFDENALTGNTGSLNVSEGGTPLTTICPEGVWQIDPDAQPTGGSNYGFKLYFTGFGSLSAADNNKFSIIKRPNPAGLGDLGNFTNGGGTISATNGAGRLYTDGYAYKWNLSSFSQFAIAKANTPLPVELLAFSAKCTEDIIELNWITASETNNDRFIIERSNNGYNYYEIGSVQGSGNSNSKITYSFRDENPAGEFDYYRLVQFDYNGNTEIFGPVTGTCTDIDNFDFKIITVIPEANNIVVVYQTGSNETTKGCLYDMNGRQIQCLSQAGEGGSRQMEFNTAVNSGIYFLTLMNSSKIISLKVFIP